MGRPTKARKDRTSLVIATVLHVVLIGGIAYWAYKTGQIEKIKQAYLTYVRGEKKEKEEPKPIQQKTVAPKQLPPINQGLPPTASSGTRRAVASEAPAAAGGETFFQDTRRQVDGPSAGSAPPSTPPPTLQLAPRPVLNPATFRPPPATSIKQLLEERAKSSAVVESYGTEQISRSGVSDAGDIVGKISGSTVSEGKFAVVRGLADRYTLSTLNGVDIPSADPNRRAAQLDLFPAQFISRVDVSKTFQPDLPGGFAGGAINIVTRSFPERSIFSLSLGTSYNTQSSLRNDYLVTDRGSLDWAAMDDGTRELPSEVAATSARGDVIPLRTAALKNSFASRQFAPVPGDSSLNSSFALAFGDTTTLLGRRFGFLGGLNYKNEHSFYDNGMVAKYTLPHPTNSSGREVSFPKSDARAQSEYTWGSLATLAYEIADNQELNFNFMYVQTAEDEARRLQGKDFTLTPDGPSDPNYVEQNVIHWTQRSLQSFQLKGSHLLPELRDSKVDWVGSLATTTQDEPDHRIFQFFAQPGDPSDPSDDFFIANSSTKPSRPTRIWRELQEDNMSVRLDLTVPLSPYNGRENAFKTGLYSSQSEQTFDSRGFEIIPSGTHPFNTSGEPNSFLDPTNAPSNDYRNFNGASWHYLGEQTIQAAYLMGNFVPLDWLRLVGGARYETTDISIDTVNLTKGDTFPGNIQRNDLLPAIIATVSLRSNVQLRAAWSQTVVRPIYREISRVEIYDVALNRTITGNNKLIMSDSENYDVRLEWYPRPGELVSVGGFMKKITKPIELGAQDTANELVFYDNYEKADVMGFEVELRKNFRGFWGAPWDQLSLGFNYAYIKSEVPLTSDQRKNRALFGDTTTKRPLYEQPEYVLNADLTYDNFSSGTSITLSGGVVGRRLTLVGYGTPDEYEEPSPQLEFSISQRIGQHWKVKFSGKNLLDPTYDLIQTWPLGDRTIKSYTKGLTFGLSIGCEF